MRTPSESARLIAFVSFAFLALALGLSARAHAADDKDVKEIVKDIQSDGLDKACNVDLSYFKHGGENGREFDLEIASFPRDGGQVVIDDCEKTKRRAHRCETARIEREKGGLIGLGKRKYECTLYRMVYVEAKNKEDRSTLQFEVKRTKVRDEAQPCSPADFSSKEGDVVASCSSSNH